MTKAFENALLRVLTGQGITLNVVTTPSNIVQEQEHEIQSLKAEVKQLEREIFNVHRRYKEVVIINDRLYKWLQDNEIDPPEDETHHAVSYFKQTDPNEWV